MATDLDDRPDTDSGSDSLNPGQAYFDREFAGITNPENYDKTATPEQIKGAEQNGGEMPTGTSGLGAAASGELTDHLGKGFTNGAKLGGLGGAAMAILSSASKRQKILGGGIGGIVAGGILMFTILGSGPLEFVHIAQLLHNAHFAQQENAGDTRMGRLYRFLRKGGSPGETRLGALGSKYHAKILEDLDSIGITPEYNGADVYQGMTIDTEHENSPYKGQSPEEAAKLIEEKTGIKPTIEGGKVHLKADTYFKQKASLRSALTDLGESKISTATRLRVLSKFGLVSWHPLKIADKKLNQTLAERYKAWRDQREERLKSQAPEASLDTTGATEEDTTTDSNGKTTTTKTAVPGESGSLGESDVKTKLSAIAGSKSLKITGGLATAVGLVCMAKAVDDHVADIRYIQVIVPLTKMGMDAVATGYQIMSGQDVDMEQLSFLAKSFQGVEKGKTTTWNQSESLRSSTGQEGGTDIDSQTKELITQDKLSWLAWTQGGAVGTLCSGAGQVVTGAVSLVLGIFSGGIISTVTGAVVSGLAGPLVIDKLSAVLAGQAIDVLAQGSRWGTYIDYGARLGANAGALSMGGVALTPKQAAEINNSTYQEQLADFQSESLYSRLFSTSDYRSLSSQIMERSAGTSVSDNIASLISGFRDIGSLVANVPLSIFSRTATAAPQPYDYGFPQYGFSQEDLNNPTVDDPYANADASAAILDTPCEINGQPNHPCGQDYIDKASKCFGVDISKGADGWDAVAQKDIDVYNSSYDQSGCASSDTNWLRIRFFIFDTGIMSGYTCYKMNDSQSCEDSGFGSASAATSSTSTSTTGNVSGSAQQLAQAILNNKNIQLTGRDVMADIQAAAQNKPGTAGVLTSAAILQLISDVGQSHTVVITAIQSGGTGHCNDTPKTACPTDPHYTGDAVDFGALDGNTLTGRDPSSLAIMQIAFSDLPAGAGFGQSNCGTTPPLPKGDTTFYDSCNHLHVDVPAGTP